MKPLPGTSNTGLRYRPCSLRCTSIPSMARHSASGKNDTAYSFREALFAEVIVGVDPDPANSQNITAWCKDYWDALHPYSAGGAYVNFTMEEGQDRVQASYRDNYRRLADI